MKAGLGVAAALIGAALVGVGAWRLLSEPAPVVPADAKHAVEIAGPPAAAPSTDAGPGTPAVAAPPTPLAAAPFAERPTRELEVLVVGADDRPVEGAEVRCFAWPAKADDDAARAESGPSGVPAAGAGAARTSRGAPKVEPFAAVLNSDAEGRVRIPWDGGRVLAFARKGRLAGRGNWRTPTPDEPLRLKLKAGVLVEVVDPDGRPAEDAAVVVGPQDEQEPPSGEGAGRRTDRAGGAVFDGRAVRNAAKLAHASTAKKGDPEPKLVLRALVPGLPFAECPSAPFPEKDDGEPVRLRLPPTSALEIRVVDAAGAAVSGEFEAWVGVGEASLSSTLQYLPYGTASPSRAHRTEPAESGRNGVARFARVAAVRKVRIGVRFADAGFQFVETDAETAAAGGATTVTVGAGKRTTRIRGRLVDPDGAAVRAMHVYVQVAPAAGDAPSEEEEDPVRSLDGQIVKQGEDGRFEVLMQKRAEALVGRTVHVSGAREAPAERDARRRVVAPPVPFELAATLAAADAEGVFDLGDLRIAPPNVVAAGTVVDEDGKPVASAHVRPRRRRTAEEAERNAPEFVDDWSGGMPAQGFSDATGKFQLTKESASAALFRGFAEALKEAAERGAAAEWRLFAEKDGYYADDGAPFVEGQRDVKVVLRKAAALEGGFAPFPPGVAPNAFEVRLFGAAAEPLRTNGWSDPEDGVDLRVDRGRFATKRLKPGPLRVVVRHSTAAAPLLEVDVVAVAGETLRDPRLQRIDVVAALGLRVVSVVDERGAPIISARVHVAGTDESPWTELGADAAGKVAVPCPGGATPRIVVTAEGYRGVEFAALDADRTVALSKVVPTRLKLRLAAATPQPLPGLELVVSLSVRDEDFGAPGPNGDSADLEARMQARWRRSMHPLRPKASMGRFTFTDGGTGAATPGVVYDVSVLLRKTGGDFLEVVNAGTVTVPADAAELEATIVPDAEEWAVAACGKKENPPPSDSGGGDDGDDGGQR
jgi:hypothetical protein